MDVRNIMETKLYRAVFEGDCGSLVKLTRNNLEVLKGITPQGNSVLHVAASRGHHEMVEVLINLKPCILSMKNNKDETPLHKAAAAGHLQVVELLLNINHQLRSNCGAHERDDLEACYSNLMFDVELLWRSVNKDNETALHYAARGGYVGIVEILLEKVKGIEAVVNKAGESALYTACDHRRAEVAMLLNDLPSVQVSRADGRTCLHAAIDTKQADLALELLNKRRGLALKADNSGNMPLHLAILNGSLDSVKEILMIAPETSFHVNEDKMAPIHIAAKVGCVESIRLLIESAPHCIEMLGKHNKSALHFAMENGKNWQVEEYLLQNVPDAAFLVNEPDDEGNTPLHISLKFTNLKAVERMLQVSSWNVKAVNRERITALLENSQGHNSREITFAKEDAQTSNTEEETSIINKINKEFQTVQEVSENSNSKKLSVQTLSIIATLIATATFAAAFTIPRGVSSDEGIPVRMHSAALKAFIISDTVAMCFSMLALLLLLDGQHFNPQNVSTVASDLVSWAFMATMVSYSTGLYILVAPWCLWLAVFTCTAGCTAPFIKTALLSRSIVLSMWNKLNLSNTDSHIQWQQNPSYH